MGGPCHGTRNTTPRVPAPVFPRMTRPESALGPERLLHCSMERTVVRTVDPETGREEVKKVLSRGSVVDAERELEIGQRLESLAIPKHLAAGTDAVTGRPCIRTAYHAG